MSEGLQNAIALGQERVNRVVEFQGQSTRPTFDWVMRQKKRPLNDFGERIPVYTAEPGGHTFFNYSNPDFRDAIAPEDEAMRIYPSRYAIPIKLNGDMLRALKRNDKNYWLTYQQRLDRTANVAKKVLSRHFHGDATGTLAISGTTIGGTGVATMAGTMTSGGTSGQAKTKGTAFLQKNEIYNAINPSTEAIRGTFTVLSEGRTQVSVNVTAGTVSTNDPIVLAGSWKKVPVGLRHLVNSANRVLQNFDTANADNLNTPMYDNGGNPISPAAFSLAKGLMQTYTNDEGEEKGKMCVMTFGHQKTLVNQAFQYRQYTNPKGDMTVYGVGSKYVDMDGDIHFVDSDAADEQIRLLDANSFYVGEDMPWGVYNDDGLDWRMLPGANGTGSDRWAYSIGWQGQFAKAGVAFCDALIDDIAHVGADYITQTS